MNQAIKPADFFTVEIDVSKYTIDAGDSRDPTLIDNVGETDLN